MNEADRLRALGANIQDQDDLERNVGRQADQMLSERAKELDQNRLERAKAAKLKLEGQIRKIDSQLRPIPPPQAVRQKLEKELDHYHAQLRTLDDDIDQISARIRAHQGDLDDLGREKSHDGRFLGESQREFLIRTGKITPFSNLAKPQAKISSDLRETLLDAEQGLLTNEDEADSYIHQHEERSHVHLKRPGFRVNEASSPSADEDYATPSPGKKRRLIRKGDASSGRYRHSDHEDADFIASASSRASSFDDDQLQIESSDADEDPFQPELATKGSKKTKRASRRRSSRSPSTALSDEKDDLAGVDDGNEDVYRLRLAKWAESRSVAREKARAKTDAPDLPDDDEWFLPHPSEPDLDLGNGYRLPGDIHPALFDYQRVGVRWLSELHQKQVGGIVGDEMGLGKTIQIISMLAALHYSKKIERPILVVCPATVMKQWVNEFHTWWPALRVSILHASGSGMMNLSKETREEDAMADRTNGGGGSRQTKAEKAAAKIVNRVIKDGHVLITTYAGLQNYAEFLIPIDWDYAVLDEGHKIRNPNSSITVHCKELRTANRIILSGTPIQNNLTELWSLFDFVYPMRLGTLMTFRTEFEIPIKLGGYANATNYQVTVAAKCAETLKDSIQPHLLQRMKVDVATDLPLKTEQVLFCTLTPEQRLHYRRFLQSGDLKAISAGKRNPLYGIDILRKICNHPDLTEHKQLKRLPQYDYGNPRVSGKMIVVRELIDMWSKGGHKTLLFCQYKIMLDILEKDISRIPGINHCRMDGGTSIKNRQEMIDKFNNDPSMHVFLLTTKTGGLGVNLTGADRVIIFDPDWNPSTDLQARERAWRLGQKRQVQIYRLMMAGTIEEKMFHRQIFKQFLTNKILKDPKQRSNFQLKELHDLFTLDEATEGTETGKMFRGAETHIKNSTNPEPEPEPETIHTKPGESVRHLNKRQPAKMNTSTVDDDLKHIDGISKIEDDNHNKADDQNKGESADQRLLTGIFARSGVTSTFEHDRIVNGKIDYGADQRILNQHAEEVARKAAASLRRAEQLARANPVGTVTWTGEVGTGGRPPSPKRKEKRSSESHNIGGSGSASILNGLRQSNTNINGATTPQRIRSSRDPDVRTAENPTAEDWGLMIIKFLTAQGGTAFTRMLSDQFRHRVNTPERVAVFNAMLKEVATLKKGSNGRGQWTIKAEYSKT